MTKVGEARGLALRAMQRQITAMGSRAYDVAVLDRSSSTMQRRLHWVSPLPEANATRMLRSEHLYLPLHALVATGSAARPARAVGLARE